MSKSVLVNLIKEAVTKYSNKPFIIDREIYRRKTLTYRQIYRHSISFCSYFRERKIKKGDKILIYLPNSRDYASILWACALSGVIAVPIDFNVKPEFAEKIYHQVNAKLIFCSIYKNVGIKNKFYSEEIPAILNSKKYSAAESIINKKLKPSDIFEIVYTSGTTSEPKGVVLTNENLYSDIVAMRKMITFDLKNKAILSLLPLSHLFEQTAGFFCPIERGVSIVYIQSRKPSNIIQAIKEEKIRAMITVPLFLDSMKEKIEFEAERAGKLESLRYNLKAFSQLPKPFKRAVFRKITKNFPNLQYFFSGGAELSAETEEFWDNLGLTVLQGYGLTEASPVVSCNSSRTRKFGTVGKPLENIEVKIDDGEIIVRGKNVFKGYYKNQGKTHETLKSGWLQTGDLGTIDEEGFLRIIGRKKNVIISPSGLNIYPEDIEKVLSRFSELKEAVVLGLDSGKKIIAAIIPSRKLSEKEISSLLAEINSKLQSHQLLSEIYIWHDSEFPKTSTLKIKRGLVHEGILSNKSLKSSEQQSSDKLINIISEVCQKPAKSMKENSGLVNFGLDSIKRIELSIKIEEAFGVDFDEDSVTEKTTLEDLRQIIKKHEKSKSESGINGFNSKFLNWPRLALQYLTFLLLKPWYSLEIKGRENIPKENSIFIANHASHFDTPLLLKSFPVKRRKSLFIAGAKDYFFKSRFKGNSLRLLFNVFAFSRTKNIKQSLLDFGKIIDKNGSILIFPEGTRSITGEIAEFKSGIGLLAQNMQVPVVPVRIIGTHSILPKGKTFPKRGKVKIVFGKPRVFNKTQSMHEISRELKSEIEKLT